MSKARSTPKRRPILLQNILKIMENDVGNATEDIYTLTYKICNFQEMDGKKPAEKRIFHQVKSAVKFAKQYGILKTKERSKFGLTQPAKVLLKYFNYAQCSKPCCTSANKIVNLKRTRQREEEEEEQAEGAEEFEGDYKTDNKRYKLTVANFCNEEGSLEDCDSIRTECSSNNNLLPKKDIIPPPKVPKIPFTEFCNCYHDSPNYSLSECSCSLCQDLSEDDFSADAMSSDSDYDFEQDKCRKRRRKSRSRTRRKSRSRKRRSCGRRRKPAKRKRRRKTTRAAKRKSKSCPSRRARRKQPKLPCQDKKTDEDKAKTNNKTENVKQSPGEKSKTNTTASKKESRKEFKPNQINTSQIETNDQIEEPKPKQRKISDTHSYETRSKSNVAQNVDTSRYSDNDFINILYT